MKYYIEEINKIIIKNSNLDLHRNYVGMSQLHGCSKDIYFNFFNSINPTLIDYKNSYRGYFFEGEVKKILIEAGIMKPNSEKELKWNVDERVCGHTDGETIAGFLIEIKSVSQEKYDKIIQTGKLPFRIFNQCNNYMGFGNYKKCCVVIVSTSTFDFNVIWLDFNKNVFCRTLHKTQYLMHCIDNKIIPKCDCNKCNLTTKAI